MKDLAFRCHKASSRAARWLAEQVQEDGSLGETDLAAYYKAPILLQMSGHTEQAHAVLGFIARTFGRAEGDFATSPQNKTADPALAQYPGYLNGWIIQAAHYMGCYNLSYQGYAWLRRFAHPDGAGGLDGPPGTGGDTVELLMTCHIGAVALVMGDRPVACAAGNALQVFWNAQPAIDARLYLRLDKLRRPLTEDHGDMAILRVVEANAEGQLWFFTGYPIAFLTLLYHATSKSGYLDLAKEYADFALHCPALPREHYAHKVAWGAALLADATGETKYRDLAARITETLVGTQTEAGDWLSEQPRVTRLDQSAELGLRLGEIGAYLR
jgi:hypothetical protein